MPKLSFKSKRGNIATQSSSVGGQQKGSRKQAERDGEESPILIGLMGVTGSGKSNFIQKITGDASIVSSSNLSSCTKEVGSTRIQMHGRTVELVDTPGFSDTKMSNADVLELIGNWMKKSYDEGTKLHGIIYLQRIDDVRFDASAVTSLMLFSKICGEDFLKNTAMVTTRWDRARDDEDLDQFTRNEKEFKESEDMWKILLEQGATYYRSPNTIEVFNEIISEIVGKAPNIPKLQQQLGEQGLELSATAAAEGLGESLAKQRAMHEKQLQEIKEMYEKQLKEGKEELARISARQMAQQEAHLEKNKQDLKKLGLWGKLYNRTAKLVQDAVGSAAETFEKGGLTFLAGVARGGEKAVIGAFDLGRIIINEEPEKPEKPAKLKGVYDLRTISSSKGAIKVKK